MSSQRVTTNRGHRCLVSRAQSEYTLSELPADPIHFLKNIFPFRHRVGVFQKVMFFDGSWNVQLEMCPPHPERQNYVSHLKSEKGSENQNENVNRNENENENRNEND